MAKQLGNYLTDGSINNITYRHTKYGYLTQNKSRLTKEKVLTDPTFLLTRKVMTEFKKAALGGALLRHSLADTIKKAKDDEVLQRMQKLLTTVVEGDTINQFGERTVEDGAVALIKGLDFNAHAPLSQKFSAPFTEVVDRVAGTITNNIASFIPLGRLSAPLNTTHFSITFAGIEVDFALGDYTIDQQETAILPWDGTATALINQVCTVTAGTVLPLFGVLGVRFYKEVNGTYWERSDHGFNFLNVVVADKV